MPLDPTYLQSFPNLHMEVSRFREGFTGMRADLGRLYRRMYSIEEGVSYFRGFVDRQAEREHRRIQREEEWVMMEAREYAERWQMNALVTPQVWLKEDRSDYLYHQMCTFLFGKPTLKNSTVKRACWGAILGWVTSWEVSWAACERGRNMLERLVMICGASHQSMKPLLVKPATKRGAALQMVSEPTRDRELR